jgi:hypothetical protein
MFMKFLHSERFQKKLRRKDAPFRWKEAYTEARLVDG